MRNWIFCRSRSIIEKMNVLGFSVVILLCLLVGLTVSHPLSYGQDPEVNYDAMELISSKGYPAEAHTVITEDGYVLVMHRIPGPRRTLQQDKKRPVFFLQHGVLCSSTNWLTNLANESLAYLLADAGFDVWMGNTRGNTYSKNHTSLKPTQKEFWDFTFDEHSAKDLPAMINYVLDTSQQADLFYVGHSQGTIMGFAGFTLNQTLAKQIKAFFALAPVTTVKHIEGILQPLSDIYDIIYVLEFITDGEFLPTSKLVKYLSELVCTPRLKLVDGLCQDILFLLCGFDPDSKNFNQTRLPVYYSHTPAGTSVKNILHYAQEVKSGLFSMYKYRTEVENVKHYGRPTPPSYNLTELNVPTALFTGGHDWLADPTDVNASIPVLNTTGHVFYRKHIAHYDHLDFIWGLDAPSLVYSDIITMAKQLLQRVRLPYISNT